MATNKKFGFICNDSIVTKTNLMKPAIVTVFAIVFMYLSSFAQRSDNQSYLIHHLAEINFPYKTANIKINGRSASYEDMLNIKGDSVLKAEWYNRKTAVKLFGKEEGRGGIILITTRHKTPLLYEEKMLEDSTSFYVKEDDTVYTRLKIKPTIQGDTTLKAWMIFIQRNLHPEVPTDEGAPSGTYEVLASFIINKNGTLSNIQVDEDPGYGTGAEVMRLLSRSPLWNPAFYNNKPVNSLVMQRFTFQVSEMY